MWKREGERIVKQRSERSGARDSWIFSDPEEAGSKVVAGTQKRVGWVIYIYIYIPLSIYYSIETQRMVERSRSDDSASNRQFSSLSLSSCKAAELPHSSKRRTVVDDFVFLFFLNLSFLSYIYSHICHHSFST